MIKFAICSIALTWRLLYSRVLCDLIYSVDMPSRELQARHRSPILCFDPFSWRHRPSTYRFKFSSQITKFHSALQCPCLVWSAGLSQSRYRLVTWPSVSTLDLRQHTVVSSPSSAQRFRPLSPPCRLLNRRRSSPGTRHRSPPCGWCATLPACRTASG